MTLSRRTYAIAGLITLLSAISLSSTHHTVAAGFANPQPVVVTNGSGQPVPTTVSSLPAVQIGANNTVTVGNQPTVNIGANQTISIAGEPTVHVDPNDTITVGGNVTSTIASNQTIGINNTSSNPVQVKEVDEPTRTPVRYSSIISLDNSFGNQGFFYTVPSGKRLVIQSMFCACQAPSGQAFVIVRLNEWPIPINDRGAATGTEFEDGVSNVTASYDPGTQLTFAVFRNGSSGSANADMGFSGYLVDAS